MQASDAYGPVVRCSAVTDSHLKIVSYEVTRDGKVGGFEWERRARKFRSTQAADVDAAVSGYKKTPRRAFF